MADLSDAQVRDLAQKILARPEYDHAHPTVAQNWLKSILEYLFHWLDRLQVLHVSAPGLYWLVMFGLFAIFAILVAHIAWTISTALRAPEPPDPSSTEGERADLAQDAAMLASAGSYLEAAHTLMIASFRTLGERSIIELRPDRANRWIRGALLDSGLDRQLAASLETLIDRTERHWFGDRVNNPVIYSQWRSAYSKLTQTLPT